MLTSPHQRLYLVRGHGGGRVGKLRQLMLLLLACLGGRRRRRFSAAFAAAAAAAFLLRLRRPLQLLDRGELRQLLADGEAGGGGSGGGRGGRRRQG